MVSIVITRSPQFKPRSLSLHKTSQDYGLEGQRTISCMVILNLLMARTSLNSLIWNFTLIIPCGHHTWAPLLAAATAPAPPGSSSLPWAKLQESPLVQFPCAKYLQRMVFEILRLRVFSQWGWTPCGSWGWKSQIKWFGVLGQQESPVFLFKI